MPDDKPKQFTSSREQWNKLKPFARQMRQEPTPAEAKLWQALRNRQVQGAKFRRQHSIGGFIVDFVCLERQLVIEVDGSIHQEPEQRAYDAQRQAHLNQSGFQVLRFHNDDIFSALDAVLTTLEQALTQA